MTTSAPENPPSTVSVRGLGVTYPTAQGMLHAVSDLSLDLVPGEILGIVGESGSGKTTVAAALLGLLARDLVRGEAQVMGTDVLRAGRRQMTELRRHQVAAILQNPLGSLNPMRKIGSQLTESAKAAHNHDDNATAIASVLDDVGLAPSVLRRYPHQLSGGMNQRVAIAMALLKDPDVLIADEPTSALDVRTQASIMKLLRRIQAIRGTSVILITHDLDLALGGCDRVAVMYAGRLVELAHAPDFRANAHHPYSRALLDASPRFGQRTRVRPIPGRFSAVLDDDPGCPFRDRCERADERCADAFPAQASARTHYWCWNPTGPTADVASVGRPA